MNTMIDLDDLFSDIYYMDLPGAPFAPPPEEREAAPVTVVGQKRSADEAVGEGGDGDGSGDLTEDQKIERRERNREHAKRSRLRKKFLLESLQEQIHGLEEQLDGLKGALKKEIPHRADEIIKTICGDKDKFTPLPMPSGFGPVKTLMEPDFRLSKYLRSSVVVFSCSIIHSFFVYPNVFRNSVSFVRFAAKLCYIGSHVTGQPDCLC